MKVCSRRETVCKPAATVCIAAETVCIARARFGPLRKRFSRLRQRFTKLRKRFAFLQNTFGPLGKQFAFLRTRFATRGASLHSCRTRCDSSGASLHLARHARCLTGASRRRCVNSRATRRHSCVRRNIRMRFADTWHRSGDDAHGVDTIQSGRGRCAGGRCAGGILPVRAISPGKTVRRTHQCVTKGPDRRQYARERHPRRCRSLHMIHEPPASATVRRARIPSRAT